MTSHDEPPNVEQNLPQDPAVLDTQPSAKKKKKKPKKKKAKTPNLEDDLSELLTHMPTLRIARNKHWRYVSSYHVCYIGELVVLPYI